MTMNGPVVFICFGAFISRKACYIVSKADPPYSLERQHQSLVWLLHETSFDELIYDDESFISYFISQKGFDLDTGSRRGRGMHFISISQTSVVNAAYHSLPHTWWLMCKTWNPSLGTSIPCNAVPPTICYRVIPTVKPVFRSTESWEACTITATAKNW
jgi:hypothetical protein